MEFRFDLADLVGAPPGHEGPCVGCVDERALRGPGGAALGSVLEELGRRSAAAQGLRKPVTYGSPAGLGDHRVYLLVDGRAALGFLKVGSKRLFVSAPPVHQRAFVDVQDAFREIEPLCALDFYVHEKCQRSGLGRRLFDAMLTSEGAVPAHLGYDRPSPKLLAFLEKHFRLSKYRPQSNNFVVFDCYFEDSQSEAAPGSGGPLIRGGSCGGEAAGRQGPGHQAARACSGGERAAAAWKQRNGSTLYTGRDLGQVPDLFADAPVHRRAAAPPIF